MSSVDLHAAARIRNVAVELFGLRGIKQTTVRQIAEQAGVSPALVIHHFGSKDALRRACDDWVLDSMSGDKEGLARGDISAMGRLAASAQSFAPHMAYVAASLREGGPGADHLFDAMCDLTATVMDVGVEAGTMRLPDDGPAGVAVLVAIACGIGAFGDQIARRLGGTDLLEPAVYARYAASILDIYTRGIIVDPRFSATVNDAFGRVADGVTDLDPPSGRGPASTTTIEQEQP